MKPWTVWLAATVGMILVTVIAVKFEANIWENG